MNISKSVIATSIALVSSLHGTVANAQLEEIIVTAQKRAESLQDVPIAVSAFTGDTMKDLGVSDARDLVIFTPGLAGRQQSGSNTNYFLRGVGTNDLHLTASAAVGQYLDGVTLTSGFQAATALFDTERVEILKGPQNTLFGLNTTGGTISYHSNKPQIGEGTHGYLNTRAGSDSTFKLEGAIGFELGDQAAVRIACSTNQSDGAFTSQTNGKDYGDTDAQALRAQLLWEPADETQILFNLHYAQSENNGTAWKALGTRDPDGSGAVCAEFNPNVIPDFDRNTNCISSPVFPGPSPFLGQAGVDPSHADWEDIDINFGEENVETSGFFINIDHDFSFATLTSVTAFDRLEFQNSNDLDGLGVGRLQLSQEDDRDTFQQELRLVSNGDDDYRWIVGAYYLDEDADSFTGLRSNVPPLGRFATSPNVQLDHRKENLGLYAQGEYDFSDALTLTVGIRWSDEEIVGDYLPSNPNVTDISPDTPIYASEVNARVIAQNPGTPGFDANGFEIVRQVQQTLTNDDVGFTAKLDYQFGEDSLVYLSASRGFKGSALDIRGAYAVTRDPVQGLENSRLEPESLDAWELGYKSSYWDNKVQLNAAVFHYTYENLQQFTTVAGIPSLGNAPESEITGLDANLKLANDSGFFANVGLSILNSEVTDGGPSANPSFVEGAPLASAPELSITALASQEFKLGKGLLTLMANVSYTDEQASETLTPAVQPVERVFTVDEYTLFNASVNYSFGAEEQYQLAIFGDNLTDEHFCNGFRASDTGTLALPGAFGQHKSLGCVVSNASTRTYGLSFAYEF